MRIHVSQISIIMEKTSRGVEGICKEVIIVIDYGKQGKEGSEYMRRVKESEKWMGPIDLLVLVESIY